MAQFQHKRHYRIRGADSTIKTFSSTSDALTKISFKASNDTESPTLAHALADTDTTLITTITHSSLANQDAWIAAVHAEWASDGSSKPWNGEDSTFHVELWKIVWLHQDGSVSDTTDMDFNPYH